MSKTRVINSLLVTLEPDEDPEALKEEMEERDSVMGVKTLEVKGEITDG